jgi:hypothetical protein
MSSGWKIQVCGFFKESMIDRLARAGRQRRVAQAFAAGTILGLCSCVDNNLFQTECANISLAKL